MSVKRLVQKFGNEPRHIAPEILVAGLVERLSDDNIGAIVVSSDGITIDGIVSERDVVRGYSLYGSRIFKCRIDEIMTSDVITCRIKDETKDVMEKMIAFQVRHIPVLDEQNSLAGVISIRDLIEDRLDELNADIPAKFHVIDGDVA